MAQDLRLLPLTESEVETLRMLLSSLLNREFVEQLEEVTLGNLLWKNVIIPNAKTIMQKIGG